MASQQKAVKRLFEAALLLKPAERGSFLDRKCGSDLELRRIVEDLLSSDERAGSFLLHPPFEHLDKAAFFEQLVEDQTRSLGSRYATPPGPWSEQLKPGQILNKRFVVVRFIAKGGMGEVYEAEDLYLQRTHIALKTILPRVADDPSLRERFEREVLLPREVIHPNLCPIYEIFHCDEPPLGFLFLTMKLLPGTTLAKRLKEPPPLAANDKITIVKQICAGLVAIHGTGIIHGDIKPSNIMLDGSGVDLRLWITDFGLARAFETETTVQNPWVVAGTPGYIAPELKSGHAPSQATDLFAFGIVLHELFTGARPEVETDGSFVIASPKLNSSDTPSFCAELVRGCLDLDPKRRCQVFSQALVALGLKRRQRRPWTRRELITAAAVGVCALGIGGWVERDDLYNLSHPLPNKRFVALMAWPPSDSGAIVSTVLDSIGDRLARAEAYIKDLLVISFNDVRGLASSSPRPAESVSALGANLVLTAWLHVTASEMVLILRVLDAVTERVIRSTSVSCAQSQVGSLADRASAAAVRLLGIRQQSTVSEPDELRRLPPEVFRVFSEAESLAGEPNDVGLDQAIEKYKKALAVSPHFSLGYARLAMAYIRQHLIHSREGTLSLADSNADLAVHYNPESGTALLSKALALLYSGNTDEAVKYFRRSLGADPENPETLLYEAQAYRDLNQWPQAEMVYHQINKNRPNYWPAYNELGWILFRMAKYDEAVKAFESAAASAPEVALPLANLSTMYVELGNNEQAKLTSQRSLKVHPNAQAYLTLGDVAFEEKQYIAARDFYSEAAKLEPKSHLIWRNIADCYAMLSQPSKVKEYYAKAAAALSDELETSPRHGASWTTLAFYHAKTGDRTAADIDIKNADAYGETDVESQFMKVQALAVLGAAHDALSLLINCIDRGLSPVEVQMALDLKDLQKDPRYVARIATQQKTHDTAVH
jgi:serine/threonine protein kinase/tetratricopeptide (TPR) repeat protein